eukprot:TRINITY_DN34535_c0_g1_i1.p1 TRINITY_DN34535_c0_g1~~TRINITY_DN34535_c0_g1_i1.p1  ORF type:complete len:655 (-),score=120.25 TRINITY_DN34535_c0_g1_i1:105-2069(-)
MRTKMRRRNSWHAHSDDSRRKADDSYGIGATSQQGQSVSELQDWTDRLMALATSQQKELQKMAEAHKHAMLAAIALSSARHPSKTTGSSEELPSRRSKAFEAYDGMPKLPDVPSEQNPSTNSSQSHKTSGFPSDESTKNSTSTFSPEPTIQPEAIDASDGPPEPEFKRDFMLPRNHSSEASSASASHLHLKEQRRKALEEYNEEKQRSKFELRASSTQTLNLNQDVQTRFDSAIGIAIILNSLVMVLDLEWQGSELAVEMELQKEHSWKDVKPFFLIMEHAFCVLFIFEMFYRIKIDRMKYFHKAMNLFDAFLVVITCIDLYILTPLMQVQGSVNNVILLRLLRTAKLVRAVRIVRTLRLFRGLRVLVQACTSFLPSLCWAMVLLGLFMMMGGLVMGNLLQDFLSDEGQPYEDRVWIWRHYGTAHRAIYTMYEITFAGNWPVYARPVLEKVSHLFTIFFLLYITFIVFAVIRVITAIFLKDTLEAASNDAEMLVQEKMTRKAAFVKKLEAVFIATDTSGDGTISEEEMCAMLEDSKFRTYLHALDLEVHEGAALFQLLDDGDKELTYDEFINGILRFKGPARAIDQIAMHVDIKELCANMTQLLKNLEEVRVIPEGRFKEHRPKTEQMKMFRNCGTAYFSHNGSDTHFGDSSNK